MPLLSLIVAYVNLGAELHLLNLNFDLVLTSCLGLTILLIAKLAVIKNLAYRRLCIWCNLHKIHSVLTSTLQCIIHTKKTKLPPVGINQTTGAASNLLVNTRAIVLGYLLHLPFVQQLGAVAIKNSQAHTHPGDKRSRKACKHMNCPTRQLQYAPCRWGSTYNPASKYLNRIPR